MPLDPHTIYTILHIFGAVLGAGGAYVSDAMFFSSVKDKVISKTELRFLKIGSRFVWGGLALALVSGALLFSLNPAGYLASSKFLIKMFVVAVIAINGVVFHILHLPRMREHADTHYPSSEKFMRNVPFLVASGVVSMTSWTLAIILGLLPSIPVSFATALVAYLAFEAIAISGALLLRKRIM